MSGRDTFILDIEWNRETWTSIALPSLVGPFETPKEADEWARLNIPNGTYEVRPLAWPYYVTPGTREATR